MTIALSTRLKAWRENAGLSQTQVAQAAGVTQGYISQLEAGMQSGISHNKLERVADVCGVSLRVFWGPLPAKDAE